MVVTAIAIAIAAIVGGVGCLGAGIQWRDRLGIFMGVILLASGGLLINFIVQGT